MLYWVRYMTLEGATELKERGYSTPIKGYMTHGRRIHGTRRKDTGVRIGYIKGYRGHGVGRYMNAEEVYKIQQGMIRE